MQFRRLMMMLAVVSLTFLSSLASAVADDLPTPQGRVILTIEGAIEHTNGPGRAEFDYEMLAALGLVSRVPETLLSAPGTRFEGIPAKTLMEYVGAAGESVEAVAANDYRSKIPMADLTGDETFLALSRNGERMSLRDRGPVWLIYEDSEDAKTSRAQQKARSVWQLKSLLVIE